VYTRILLTDGATDFALLRTRLPALNTFRNLCLQPEVQVAIGQLKQLNWAG
jgi:hypothetical protein